MSRCVRTVWLASGVALSMAATSALGQARRYAAFNSPSDTIRINGGNTVFGGGDFTYEARIWLDGPFGQLISEQRTGSEDKCVSMGEASFLASGVTCGSSGDCSGDLAQLSVGRWHHVAWVHSGPSVTMYVDGIVVFSKVPVDYAYGDAADSWMSVGAFCKGAGGGSPAYFPSLIGRIDWLRVSGVARYAEPFSPPVEGDIVVDDHTQLLLRFNEAPGTGLLVDESVNQFLCDVGVSDGSCFTATRPIIGIDHACTVSITSQPLHVAVGVDTPVTFIVGAANGGECTTDIRYQWQRRDPTVADDHAPNAWRDLADGGGYFNTRTAAMIIQPPTPSQATGYRCRIGGGCDCEPLFTNTVNFSVSCPADFNADGGVDGMDVEAFFQRWEAGC